MTTAFVERLVARLESRGLAYAGSLRGCTDEDLASVGRLCRGNIPKFYEDFLRTMGRGMGRFFLGTDVQYPDLLDFTECLREAMNEDEGVAIPDVAIAFGMHQGYSFMYFLNDEGDDPPVYHYMEGSGEVSVVNERLSEYFLDAALDEW